MTAIIILICTILLIILGLITKNEKFAKFLPISKRKLLVNNHIIISATLSIIIGIAVFIDSFDMNSDFKDLKAGQNDILKEISLTQKKKDSIINFYNSRLDLKGEELNIAREKIKELISQLDYYNKSTDEVIRKSYGLFLNGEFDNAISVLDVYAEKATEERLIKIYDLKLDLYTATGNFKKALEYSRKLFHLQNSAIRKYYYAEMLFLNDEIEESHDLLNELHKELIDNPEILDPYNAHLVYYYMGRIMERYGYPSDALSAYKYSEIFLSLYNGEYSNKLFRKWVLINAIAINHYNSKKFEEAELILTRLVKDFEKYKCAQLHCSTFQVLAYLNLSNIVRVGRKDYKLALNYIEKAEALQNEIQFEKSSENFNNLCRLKFYKAMIYKETRNYLKAENNFEELVDLINSREYFINHEWLMTKIKANTHLAEVYKLNHKNNKAIIYFKKSLELINDHQDQHEGPALDQVKRNIESHLESLR